MADEVGDPQFAAQCRKILDVGLKNFAGQLFDGEYFSNQVDPKHSARSIPALQWIPFSLLARDKTAG